LEHRVQATSNKSATEIVQSIHQQQSIQNASRVYQDVSERMSITDRLKLHLGAPAGSNGANGDHGMNSPYDPTESPFVTPHDIIMLDNYTDEYVDGWL
jgi:hypothetical protein